MAQIARYGTVLAFLGIVGFGGLNGVAIRLSNRELAPLWGASLRFAIAAAVLLGVVALTRTPMPRGLALRGSILYGVVGFAGTFGFVYWALVEIPAGVGQVVLSIAPLLTSLLAVAYGLERLRMRGLIGGLIAVGGIAIVFGERMGAAVSPLPLLAMVVGALCMAESNVIVKRYPKCHPLANNAIAMTTATVILFAASVVAGEAHVLPSQARTWVAVSYISIVGSVGVFSLFMYVIQRWTASATSYAMLLMPLVAVVAAAIIAGESISPAFVVGGAIVLTGVYVGILWRPRPRAATAPATATGPAGLPAPAGQVAVGADAPQPILAHPGCA